MQLEANPILFSLLGNVYSGEFAAKEFPVKSPTAVEAVRVNGSCGPIRLVLLDNYAEIALAHRAGASEVLSHWCFQ